jgi:hypothetical protein
VGLVIVYGYKKKKKERREERCLYIEVLLQEGKRFVKR